MVSVNGGTPGEKPKTIFTALFCIATSLAMLVELRRCQDIQRKSWGFPRSAAASEKSMWPITNGSEEDVFGSHLLDLESLWTSSAYIETVLDEPLFKDVQAQRKRRYDKFGRSVCG